MEFGLASCLSTEVNKGRFIELSARMPMDPSFAFSLSVFLVYSAYFACPGMLALGLRLIEIVDSVLN